VWRARSKVKRGLSWRGGVRGRRKEWRQKVQGIRGGRSFGISNGWLAGGEQGCRPAVERDKSTEKALSWREKEDDVQSCVR